VAANIDWTLLTPESKATLRLAALISAGFSPAEAGAVYGLSTKEVKCAMTVLREEIRAQAEI
jgi:DNA-directed RNA polymerase specialized sigma24 family protein